MHFFQVVIRNALDPLGRRNVIRHRSDQADRALLQARVSRLHRSRVVCKSADPAINCNCAGHGSPGLALVRTGGLPIGLGRACGQRNEVFEPEVSDDCVVIEQDEVFTTGRPQALVDRRGNPRFRVFWTIVTGTRPPTWTPAR